MQEEEGGEREEQKVHDQEQGKTKNRKNNRARKSKLKLEGSERVATWQDLQNLVHGLLVAQAPA